MYRDRKAPHRSRNVKEHIECTRQRVDLIVLPGQMENRVTPRRMRGSSWLGQRDVSGLDLRSDRSRPGGFSTGFPQTKSRDVRRAVV